MLRGVEAFCRQILARGDLASKLAPPPPWRDFACAPVLVDRPARDPGLEMRAGVEALPRPGKLGDAAARATCLAKFAHHELMAVELFAWALLRWPDLPRAMQKGLVQILREEQEHCRLYLDRLAAHGARLQEHVLSDYFWKHAPAIAASPAGPKAFLSAMGLTLEQGNLDFGPLYRDAFRAAGDGDSAAVCERVHRDEIGHVRFAAHWLRVLPDETGAPGAAHAGDDDEIARYEETVPFPLSAARAKGRRFNVEARRAAGLSDAFIEHVRGARPAPRQPGRPTARERGPA